eukprot:7342964-Pyramimonas_sp.AAC.1
MLRDYIFWSCYGFGLLRCGRTRCNWGERVASVGQIRQGEGVSEHASGGGGGPNFGRSWRSGASEVVGAAGAAAIECTGPRNRRAWQPGGGTVSSHPPPSPSKARNISLVLVNDATAAKPAGVCTQRSASRVSKLITY